MFKSLEDILVEYFGCKGNAFLENPRENNDGTYEYFTKSGAVAYEKLVALICDLENLGLFEDCDTSAEEIIDIIDGIVRQN